MITILSALVPLRRGRAFFQEKQLTSSACCELARTGMVPSERSSGETIRRGGITKTGNTHARRALVEGAWAYRMKARIGRHKVDRLEAMPKVVREIGWKAQVRLCAR